MKKGVSIIICCYNSSELLEQSLLHICNMKVPSDIDWEVVVVDNNSVDNTSEAAGKYLKEYKCPVPYKILYQPVPGLSSARKMGFDKSEYEYLIFCDDDNWLSNNYLEISFREMEANNKIGALGGESEAISDVEFPVWFKEYERNYSVGKQAEKGGEITWNQNGLWGAGMVLRKSALNELFSKGYKSLLSDRKGNELSSGGDIELCYALRLAGWEIWYEPKLRLKHFITKEKLNWNYLRKLNRGFGAQKVDFDAYLKVFDPEPVTFKENLNQKWQYQSISLLKKIRGYGIKKLLKFKDSCEGDSEILRIEKSIGRLNELLKIRGQYANRLKSVKHANWRKIFFTP